MVYQVNGELHVHVHCRECFGGCIKSEGEQELEDDYSYFYGGPEGSHMQIQNLAAN